MSKLFEFVVVYRPKALRDAAGNDITPPDELLVDVTRVLARDDKTAGMMAVRKIPDSHADKLDQLEVIVRPF